LEPPQFVLLALKEVVTQLGIPAAVTRSFMTTNSALTSGLQITDGSFEAVSRQPRIPKLPVPLLKSGAE
jgi:hypothetical protein